MSSNFSISMRSLRSSFATAAENNEIDWSEGEGVSKAQLVNFALVDMQKEIAAAMKARESAMLDLGNGIKLPFGEAYDEASDAIKTLQAKQAFLTDMVTVEDTTADDKTIFDKLDANNDGKLSKDELNGLDSNNDYKADITDLNAKFTTDSKLEGFADKLSKDDKKSLAETFEVELKSGIDFMSILPKLLTGQANLAELLPQLLGEDNDDPLLALLPALMGGGNPIAALLPLLLNDNDSSSSSDDSLTKLLPIILLMGQQSQPAPAPAPAPQPPYNPNPWGGGMGGFPNIPGYTGGMGGFGF